MIPNLSALERAFQLAKSGRVGGITAIRAQLKCEGYDDKVLDGGRSLSLQLRGLVKAARSASDSAREH
jgi:hypothetical protein